jgi:hypothetical protein
MSKNSKARPHPGIQTGSIEFSLTMPLVLLAAAAADANSAHDLAVRLDGNATRENHHPGMVRYVDAEELVSRLAVAAKLQRRDIEGLRSEGLVDGDVDAAKPRPIHAHESRQVGACIDDGNIHRLADFLRLHDPAPMIPCAFSIVIMTVELLIADSQAAFANKARWWSRIWQWMSLISHCISVGGADLFV